MGTDEGRNDKKKSEVDKVKAKLEEEEEKSSEYMHKFQWLQAEFNNYKKQIEREKDEIFNYANSKIISRFLLILDELEAASLKTGDDGIKMIYEHFLDALESEGLRKVDALNKKFDPNVHDAVDVSIVKDESKNEMIVEELRKGYFLKEKLLRPSMVKVGKYEDKGIDIGEGEGKKEDKGEREE